MENINSVIRKLVLIDAILYTKLLEKLNEGKIKVSEADYVAYINEKGEIYLGKDFFKRNEKEKLFILLHEMMHEVLSHFMRFKNIKIKRGGKVINLTYIINIATDLAINSILDKEIRENNKMRALAKTPSDALLPSKFNFPSEKSAEYYLYSLLKDIDKILNNMNNLPRNFDRHEGDFENENESKNENGEGENRNKNEEEYENKENIEEIIDMDNENVDEVIDKISEKMKSNNNINNNKGWDVGEDSELIKRIIRNIVGTNTINWKSIIKNNLINFIKTLSKKVEERIDRKNMIRNIYLTDLPMIIPIIYRRKEEFKVNLNIFVDTSGSISQKELEEFIYQLYKITEDIENISAMNIYLFADRIYYKKELDLRNKVNTNDIIKKEIEEIKENIKGGGTSFEEIKEIYNKDKDKGIYIIFTDGYAERVDIRSSKNKKLIWIIVNNKEFQDKNNTVIHIEV